MTESVPISRPETRIGPGRKPRRSFIGAIVAMVIVGVLLAWWLQPDGKQEAHGWQELADGMQMRCFGMEELGIRGREWFEVCSFRAEKKKVSLKIAWRSDGIDYPSLLDGLGTMAAINGGFYDEEYRPKGWLVIDGIERSPMVEEYSGLLHVDRKGQMHIGWAKDAPAALPLYALQSSPLLVEPDGVMGIRGQSAWDCSARSCICMDFHDRVHLVSTRIQDPPSTGLTLYELAEWLTRDERKGGLGARVCMNLDGGPLAALYVQSKGVSFSSCEHTGTGNGEKKVTSPTAIVVVPK